MCKKCKLITLLRLEKLSMSDNTEDPKYQVTINATARKKAPQISIFCFFCLCENHLLITKLSFHSHVFLSVVVSRSQLQIEYSEEKGNMSSS
jgi:hypothetical protein